VVGHAEVVVALCVADEVDLRRHLGGLERKSRQPVENIKIGGGAAKG